MNTQAKPGEQITQRCSSRNEKQNSVTETVKITIKEESADLSKSEEELILNYGLFLYNLCS